jgi:hypothetical protein
MGYPWQPTATVCNNLQQHERKLRKIPQLRMNPPERERSPRRRVRHDTKESPWLMIPTLHDERGRPIMYLRPPSPRLAWSTPFLIELRPAERPENMPDLYQHALRRLD